MQTKSTTTEEARASRRCFIVDAEGKVLGRLATEVAKRLRGKHLVSFTPHADSGDLVIVVNASKVRLTGRKEDKKLYQYHTGWVGGVVTRTAAQQRAHRAETMIENAVRGMLPKTILGRRAGKRLKVYSGAAHPHQAQQPVTLAV